uniref:WD repeat, SAM and U-box domain-containing protein 1-like n=1 Tax=Scatophagus argus TaxID=75038 RepID=UPI001ED7CBE9|nr:WD repeat, SAM and U-box domain-containing protein 1-like [Scatophagus argus]
MPDNSDMTLLQIRLYSRAAGGSASQTVHDAAGHFVRSFVPPLCFQENFWLSQCAASRQVFPTALQSPLPSHRRIFERFLRHLVSEPLHRLQHHKMVSLSVTLRHHTDEVSCCAFSPSLLATSSGDKTIRVYSAADFSELPFSPLSGHGYGVHCCCFSSCGSFLISCSTDGCVIAWSADSGQVAAVLQHPDRSPLRACALSPGSSLLLAGACDGTVALWDFPSKTLRRCSSVSEASVVACCFSPCGQMFATGCTGGDLKLWDSDVRLLHAEKDAHDLGVTCCSFAPQFKVDDCCAEFRLASCGQDSQLKIWIVSQSEGAVFVVKLLHALTSQSAPVLSCAFSSDGELIVSGSVDKSVAIYDANLGTLFDTLKQHDRYVTAVAVSPTMPWIATGSMDRTVNVWRMGDGVGATAAESSQTVCQGRKLPGHSRLLVADWSEEDVQAWLCDEGLQELVSVFKTNNIDGAELSRISKDTAAELGIESVGLRGRLMRKIEALKAEQSGSEAPDEFLCPITRELMKDPVIAADGYSYERDSIESWIRGKNKTSPMTNLPLQTTLLTPNRSLKMAIARWKSSQ